MIFHQINTKINVIKRFKVPQSLQCLSRRLCSTKSDDTGNKSDGKTEDVKQKVLSASLPFVHQYGWTEDAISAGAESIGYPGIIRGMFPQGGSELVHYFYSSCNKMLSEKLKEESEVSKSNPSLKKETAVFVRDAVEYRLRLVVPYLDKWPQAIGLMALPPNVPTTLANVLSLVDDICFYAGDRSVDFNWYVHRISLAGIYKMTELVLIQDKSEDFKHTWEFLNRRIDDASHLHNCVVQTEEVSQFTKETFSAAFITARNILGMNVGNR